MSSRRMIDLMIQRSAVELFASLGVAIAPTPAMVGPGRFNPEDMVGIVQLSLNGVRGSLSICVSNSTLERAKGQIPGVNIQDWLRELANQLAGRVKNRLARYQVSVQVSLPSVLMKSVLDRKDESPVMPNTAPAVANIVYLFRTVKDDVQVVLSGEIGNTDLRFSGGASIAEEGDVILF